MTMHQEKKEKKKKDLTNWSQERTIAHKQLLENADPITGACGPEKI